MLRVIRAIRFSVFVGSLATGGGCATVPAEGAGAFDLHATARITGDVTWALITGPAYLLHVDVDGRDDLALYAAPRKDGTAADCAGRLTGAAKRLRPGVPNLVNLTVAADQTICVAPLRSAPYATVMWHLRRIEEGQVGGQTRAVAYDGAEH